MTRGFRQKRNKLFSSVVAILLCLCMLAEPVMATDGSGSGGGTATSTKLGEDILNGAGSFEVDSISVTTGGDGWKWNKTAQAGTAELGTDTDTENPPQGKYLKVSSDSTVQPVIKYGKGMDVYGDTTYVLEMYLRRDTEHYPYIYINDGTNKYRYITDLNTKENAEYTDTFIGSDSDKWIYINESITTSTDATTLNLSVYGGKTGAGFSIDDITIKRVIKPAEEAITKNGDVINNIGQFEDMTGITESSTWTWLDTEKYVGIATIVNDIINQSPSKGSYLNIKSSGVDSNSDEKLDQPALKWIGTGLSMKANTVYTLTFDIRRNSDQYPYVALFNNTDGSPMVSVHTSGATAGVAAVAKDSWTTVTYDFTTKEAITDLKLAVYGYGHDAAVDFDIDGISIVEKESVTPSTATTAPTAVEGDILNGKGDFEIAAFGTDWVWHRPAVYTGIADIVDDNSDVSLAGGKYLSVENSGIDLDDDGNLDQATIKWNGGTLSVEENETYVLTFYVRRSGCYPYVVLNGTGEPNIKTDGTVTGIEEVPENTWTKVNYEFTMETGDTFTGITVYSNSRNAGANFDIDGISIVKKVTTPTITPAPKPDPAVTPGDILNGDGYFENINYTIGTDTDWRWHMPKYTGVATLVDDASKMSPAKGVYLNIQSSGLDTTNDNKDNPDQPVIKYKDFPEIIEGNTIYTLHMYIRRNSEHYPYISLFDKVDGGSNNQIVSLYTQSGKDNADKKIVSITSEPAADGWQEVTYEFTTQVNATKLQLYVYGGAYATDISFDIDGISIVKKETLPTPAPKPEATAGDILNDAGDFEYETLEITTATTNGWMWHTGSGKDYTGQYQLVDNASEMSDAKGKYLEIKGLGTNQPVIKWKNYPYIIEGNTTYVLDMYIRRNSDHYPYIVLKNRKDSGSIINIAELHTEDNQTDEAAKKLSIGNEEVGKWQHIQYEFTTDADVNRFQLFIYGKDKNAAFDIDGISIVKKETPIDTSNLRDIMKGDGEFEDGVTVSLSDTKGTWNMSRYTYYGATVQIVDHEAAPSEDFGDSCLYLEYTDGKPKPNIMYKNSPAIIESGKTYILEIWVKRMSEAVPVVSLKERKDSGDLMEIASLQLLPEGSDATEHIGEWVKFTKQFTTGIQVADANKLRLSISGLDTVGDSCYIDNVRIWGEPTELELIKEAWEDRLAAEAANSMMLPSDNGVSNVWKEPMEGTPENLLVNGDFSTDISNWKGNAKTEATNPKTYGWSENGRGGEGDGCLYIDDVLTLSAPAIGQKVYNIVGGAEYQVSLWYKIDDTTNLTSDPFVDIECFAETNEPGDNGYLGGLETRLVETPIIRDGQWHQYVFRGHVPLRTDYVTVFARKTKDLGDVYIDDIVFTMTDTSNPISLNNNMKIFYSDMDSTQFEATVQTDYYPDYADGAVVFEVFDGQTSVWKSDTIALSNGKAAVTFDLNLLTKLDTPYCVMATLYDGGEAKEATSKNIYVYDRPSAINENGEYVKFNTATEIFTPVLGYHVYQNADVQHYDEVAAAGINVVQLPNALSADEVVEHLDILDALGIKGMVCLYNGMLPAGNEANVINTITKVSDTRIQNHPALFGYNIGDEPFIHQLDPRQDLENSYRLIRQYDKNNTIMCVEDLEYMVPETSSYLDALILDPYFGAAGATVYTIVDEALKEFNFKKPAWIVLSTYIHQYDGYFNTADDVRNNNYQALLAGTDGVGYFSISDPGNLYSSNLISIDPAWEGLVYPKEEGYIPVWDVKTPTNAKAGAEVWGAITAFDNEELPIVGEYFVGNKGTEVAEEINIDGGYMYHVWTAEDGTNYLVVLNIKGGDVHLDIPVAGTSAKILAGREDASLYEVEDGKLALDLVNVEALLLEMTDIPVDEAEYELGTGEAVTIKVNAAELDSVTAGDTVLEADVDYTVDTAKGELTIAEAYLEALLPGEHMIKLTYGDNYVEVVLEVVAEELLISSEKSDLKYQKGDEEGARIYCTGAFSRFRGIKKDGVEVSPANYEAEEGSTVIIFTKAYMESLSDGEHEFELVYRDGSVKAKVTVSSVKADDTTEDTTDTDNTSSDSAQDTTNSDSTSSDTTETAPTVNAGSSTTATGDNSNIVLWMMLFAAATLVGAVVLIREKKVRK